jgi:hypothetical protein
LRKLLILRGVSGFFIPAYWMVQKVAKEAGRCLSTRKIQHVSRVALSSLVPKTSTSNLKVVRKEFIESFMLSSPNLISVSLSHTFAAFSREKEA